MFESVSVETHCTLTDAIPHVQSDSSTIFPGKAQGPAKVIAPSSPQLLVELGSALDKFYRYPMHKLRHVDEREEWDLLQALEHSQSLTAEMRRLRRKLKIRRMKRLYKQTIFHLDNNFLKFQSRRHLFFTVEKTKHSDATPETNVTAPKRLLDRFQSSSHQFSSNFTYARQLLGPSEADMMAASQVFLSPFTFSKLRPFIFRDDESKTPFMMVLEDLLLYHQKKGTLCAPRSKICSIDYSYFKREHLQQVNRLLCDIFWPGIDMREALDAPDFSIVVLYGSRVIGCAFMTPECYITFIAIHSDFKDMGIGVFLLYRLIQISDRRDVTLHVSATNPAMFLYQKFKFKPEEYIIDFYDKYMHEASYESKNAFFLRYRHD